MAIFSERTSQQNERKWHFRQMFIKWYKDISRKTTKGEQHVTVVWHLVLMVLAHLGEKCPDAHFPRIEEMDPTAKELFQQFLEEAKDLAKSQAEEDYILSMFLEESLVSSILSRFQFSFLGEY